MSNDPPGGTSVNVEKAETVNVPAQPGNTLPHAKAIIAITFAILTAFVLVTFWVLFKGPAGVDAATKGAVIQTWNNLAVAAGTFWLGSSLAGKMQSGQTIRKDDEKP